ncbi:hypothetical protein AGLY_000086 [Aphis glycines]|uniref:Uncharacterized protein n=1 Tax=Aphis glycines TaxID=307491 RepID=A0A6G0U5Z7_APHGL|nr:hypothetical protein AGLY_000086 [Aphis glycines]
MCFSCLSTIICLPFFGKNTKPPSVMSICLNFFHSSSILSLISSPALNPSVLHKFNHKYYIMPGIHGKYKGVPCSLLRINLLCFTIFNSKYLYPDSSHDLGQYLQHSRTHQVACSSPQNPHHRSRIIKEKNKINPYESDILVYYQVILNIDYKSNCQLVYALCKRMRPTITIVVEEFHIFASLKFDYLSLQSFNIYSLHNFVKFVSFNFIIGYLSKYIYGFYLELINILFLYFLMTTKILKRTLLSNVSIGLSEINNYNDLTKRLFY